MKGDLSQATQITIEDLRKGFEIQKGIELKHRYETIIIQVGERYFRKWGKNGSCQTAWCVAGAKHFQLIDRDRVYAISYELHKRRKRHSILRCGIIGEECYV